MYYICTRINKITGSWCNGNTTVFGAVNSSSSLDKATIIPVVKLVNTAVLETVRISAESSSLSRNTKINTMSRTTRKDRYDRIYSKQPKDSKGYVCNCHICVGVDRIELKEKIAKRELAIELKGEVTQLVEC